LNLEITMDYSFGRTVSLTPEEAVRRVTEALATQGFGILTEIDVQATLKKKLGHDMPPYRILGACNPNFARQVIELEPEVGTLLPCNVVVRVDAAGRTVVEAMDPGVMMQMIEEPRVHEIAKQVRERLKTALDAV
jgi:uncharacterized protein (DUF302 family)